MLPLSSQKNLRPTFIAQELKKGCNIKERLNILWGFKDYYLKASSSKEVSLLVSALYDIPEADFPAQIISACMNPEIYSLSQNNGVFEIASKQDPEYDVPQHASQSVLFKRLPTFYDKYDRKKYIARLIFEIASFYSPRLVVNFILDKELPAPESLTREDARDFIEECLNLGLMKHAILIMTQYYGLGLLTPNKFEFLLLDVFPKTQKSVPTFEKFFITCFKNFRFEAANQEAKFLIWSLFSIVNDMPDLAFVLMQAALPLSFNSLENELVDKDKVAIYLAKNKNFFCWLSFKLSEYYQENSRLVKDFLLTIKKSGIEATFQKLVNSQCGKIEINFEQQVDRTIVYDVAQYLLKKARENSFKKIHAQALLNIVEIDSMLLTTFISDTITKMPLPEEFLLAFDNKSNFDFWMETIQHFANFKSEKLRNSKNTEPLESEYLARNIATMIERFVGEAGYFALKTQAEFGVQEAQIVLDLYHKGEIANYNCYLIHRRLPALSLLQDYTVSENKNYGLREIWVYRNKNLAQKYHRILQKQDAMKCVKEEQINRSKQTENPELIFSSAPTHTRPSQVVANDNCMKCLIL